MWSSPGAAGRRPPPCSGEPIAPPRAAPPPACAGCAPHAPATLGMREAASACPRRGRCRGLWCARGWLCRGLWCARGWLVPVFGLVRPRGGVGHRVGASRAGRPLGPGAGHRARERCDSGLGGVLTDVAGRGLFRARMLPGCGRRAGHASPRACTATGVTVTLTCGDTNYRGPSLVAWTVTRYRAAANTGRHLARGAARQGEATRHAGTGCHRARGHHQTCGRRRGPEDRGTRGPGGQGRRTGVGVPSPWRGARGGRPTPRRRHGAQRARSKSIAL
ncbi:hypothetical protein HMPREF1486_02638 [Streptomyces sp. HPH0547]|nr:hypothetical protein HMPREF1486_02638 [Streptomyces sp. HPH0547]